MIEVVKACRIAGDVKGCRVLVRSKGAKGHLGDHRSTFPKGCVGYEISSCCATRCSYGLTEGILLAPAEPAGRGYCFRFLAGTRGTFIGETAHSATRATCYRITERMCGDATRQKDHRGPRSHNLDPPNDIACDSPQRSRLYYYHI